MLSNSASLWLGILFVAVGATNVWLILQSTARVKNAKAGGRLVALHRIGGYLFIALYCVMGYFMVARLGSVDSPINMIHLTLAMVLSPLIFVKVLIARYYKSYYSFLLPMGLIIFVLAFVLIGVTAGPTLARKTSVKTVSLAAIDLPPAAIDLNLAAARMEKRCSKCHNLDRVTGARKSARGWLSTVNRMKALPDSGISDEDARTIVSYLASQVAPKGADAAANQEVARALVDQRCGRCHSLDRVYKMAQTPEQWRATVTRMVGLAEGSGNEIQPGEDEQIIAYLRATQTPEAVEQRKTKAADASSAGRSLVAQKAAPAAEQSAPRDQYDAKMISFVSVVGLSLLALVLRRPTRAPAPIAKTAPAAPARAIPSTALPQAGPLILKLVSITEQTHDAKTLRFVLPEERKLDARPGQFLTFSFLFDGKKVIRSYSICSSPARSGYVEITPKRVNQGTASVFLNDHAQIGMTVEAHGALGHFVFDENKDHNIVLLAAGSGITPMIAMLRYMDDRCLETKVTLLYCVRTIKDIIFEQELVELQSRLKHFRHHVLLSQPHPEWTRASGHINREFVKNAVEDLTKPDFLLCGPPPFMEASREILTGLGVDPKRIRQESFGSHPKSAAAPAAEGGVAIEFVRSGKSCSLRSGQTLLEAAEEHGVGIPSSCRQGLCGTCKTRLLGGNVSMDAEEGLDPDSRALGYVLTCVGRTDGPVRLDA